MNHDCKTTQEKQMVTLNGIKGLSENHLQIIVNL